MFTRLSDVKSAEKKFCKRKSSENTVQEKSMTDASDCILLRFFTHKHYCVSFSNEMGLNSCYLHLDPACSSRHVNISTFVFGSTGSPKHVKHPESLMHQARRFDFSY